MKAYYPTTNKTSSSSSSSNRQQHHNPLLNSVPNHHQPFGNNNTVLMPGPNPITAMFNQAAVAAMLNPFPGFNPTHQQQQQALHHNQQQQSVNHRHHSHHQSSSGSSHHHHHQQQQTHGNYVNYYTSNADGIRQYNPNNNHHHHHHHQNHNSHYNNNAQAHSGHYAKNDKIMKPEKILYSKALQGSSMSSQNSGQNINSGNIVANNPPNVIVAPTGVTLSSQGGGGGGGGVAITSSNSNEPGSNSYHHLHRSPNSGGHYGSERSGGGGGRNMNPNNSNNNLPPRMAKNYQSIYPIRHDQTYSEYRNSQRTNQQQSSAPPSTTSVSTTSVNVQQQQQANKVSTNGSTSIVSPISTLSNNSTNNNTVSSIGTINNPSSVSSNNTTNNNSSTTNGGVSGTGGTSISDKSDSSMANHHNSNTTISKTNLYIRGLTPDTTDKDLHSLCQLYGTIVSTKAILDKETNKCRGYGFVDFDNPLSAETAVKNLNEQGVQAQMAKCTDTSRNKNLQPKISLQEHDPTNLYIANLPISMTEMDLESMLSIHGKVVSTRILKDVNNASRGVGFARMESKDECDIIIDKFNGKLIPGCRDLLLVKFADGGGKKKNHYKNESRYRNDVDQLQMTFDSTNLTPNGVTAAMLPSPLGAQAYNQRFSSPYQNPLQPNPWMNAPAPQPQYIMQPPPMLTSNMDPNALQYAGPLMHQLTAQLHNIQLGGGTGFMPGNPHPYGTQLYPTQLIPTMPMSGVGGDQDPINPSHSVSSGSVSGEEQQQQQQQNQQASQQAPPSHSFQMCYNQQK